jgi:hypothetical protein
MLPSDERSPYRSGEQPGSRFEARPAVLLRSFDAEMAAAAAVAAAGLGVALVVAGTSWVAGVVLSEAVGLVAFEVLRRLPEEPAGWGEQGRVSADRAGLRWNGALALEREAIVGQSVRIRADGRAVVRLSRRRRISPLDLVVASADEARELLEALSLTPWSPPPSFAIEPIGGRERALRYLAPLPAVLSLLVLRVDLGLPRVELLAFVGLHMLTLWLFDRRPRVEIRAEGLRFKGALGQRLITWAKVARLEELRGGLRLELASGERLDIMRFAGPAADRPVPTLRAPSPLAWHASEAQADLRRRGVLPSGNPSLPAPPSFALPTAPAARTAAVPLTPLSQEALVSPEAQLTRRLA